MTMRQARATGWLLTRRSKARPSRRGRSPAGARPRPESEPRRRRRYGCCMRKARARPGSQPGRGGHGSQLPGLPGARLRTSRGADRDAVRRVHGAAQRGCRSPGALDGPRRSEPDGRDPFGRDADRAVLRRGPDLATSGNAGRAEPGQGQPEQVPTHAANRVPLDPGNAPARHRLRSVLAGRPGDRGGDRPPVRPDHRASDQYRRGRVNPERGGARGHIRRPVQIRRIG